MKLPGLKEVRELHGWSQARLAEEADVSRDSISNYETGHREAWPATARKLADALGVEIEDLARPKVIAPNTSGQPERKFRFEIKPTGPIHVTREDLAEHGISVTDAELRVLNDSLEGYRRGQETGEPYGLVALTRENIDWDRIHLLTIYVLATPGVLKSEEAEAVLQGVRDELAATSR